MNMVNYTAKNAYKIARITVGWPWGVELGHRRYQIEAKGISDYKPRLDMP